MEADPSRFREPDELRWLDPVFVVCPRCSKRATARGTKWEARLVCPACALTRTHSSKQWREVQGEDTRFGLPLWLRADCCGGHLLWANNEAHLDYLESYLGAMLRERPEGPSGLSWYLPAWMKHAKHREEVLRTIARMRASLGEG